MTGVTATRWLAPVGPAVRPSRAPRARAGRARSGRRRSDRRAGLLVLAAVLTAGACQYTVELEPLEPAPESSRILAADGTVLATLDDGVRRQSVALDDVAPTLRDAVVAIEDNRFWEHSGIDLRAIVRAARADVEAGEVAQGGSTITQQYVRTVMLGREQTVSRKLREAILAVQVEQRWSKREILEHYLNAVYFGNGAYGVEAAADRYFARPARDLTLAESALLAGLLQAPERYNPYVHPDAARERRDLVLEQMVEHGLAERADADAAKREPVGVTDAHWREEERAPYFVEQVKRFLLERDELGETRADRQRLIFQGGLVIETALDPRLQAAAEDAVAKVLVDPAHDPAAALVAVDPGTGHVVAYVGGHDYFGDAPWAKFDLAGQAQRQAGSAFKPFVLAAALEEDVPLDRTYAAPEELEIPIAGQEPWTVHNYDGEARGDLDLVDATVFSVNTVYAQLVMDVGPEDVVNLAASMGVHSQLAPYPSTALGTNGVNALDLAGAYATLAADGLRADPVFVTRVTDGDGNVLYEATPDRERVLPAEVARQVNAVLEQVVTRGTGINARIGRPVAGKTGTGEEWQDAWFVGSTPELTAAVWVGFPDAPRSMLPPLTRQRVTGGLWPAQIWALFAGSALAETPVSEFPAPGTPEGQEVKVRPLPDAAGMPVAEAAELLSDAGFVVRVEERPDGEYPPGTVLDQRPDAHAPVTPGTEVVLVVSRVPRRATVPSLLTLLTDEAIAAAGLDGLPLDVQTEAEPPPGSPDRAGRIWKQSPLAGTDVDEGTVVTVWVNPA